jgi:hypothetical protein
VRQLALVVALSLVLSAWEREPEPATPDAVVVRFIRLMQGVHGDEDQAAEVYELLWSGARENLERRAQQASAVAGRPVAPYEMIVPSRFSQEFAPKRFTFQEFGKWAVVRVYGNGPKQFREVRCALEEGKWRVVLELPEAPPIQKRLVREPTAAP